MKIEKFMEKSIEEQKIEDCIASIDTVISLQEQKLDLLKKHKQGLMQQLFAQKNLDPSGNTIEPNLKFKK